MAIGFEIFRITALEKSAIQQDLATIIQDDQVAATGNLPCCAAELDLHQSPAMPALKYSLLSLAMCSTEMLFGHSASQA